MWEHHQLGLTKCVVCEQVIVDENHKCPQEILDEIDQQDYTDEEFDFYDLV